ncbi:MAG TPA: ATP-binding protein, partial [Candidatus Obscuribacterales bacterium]
LTFDELKVSYQFLHDRVQQAAYFLILEAQKKETHFKIGQLLLKNTKPEDRKENIFALVNQLNFGVDLITCQEEKEELAQLNLIAGQKAKAATAYEPAVRYLNVGLGLLSTDSWQRQYKLTLNLYVEAVEAEYLNTNFERSAALAEVVLQQASTLLDKVKVYELQIQFYMAQNQMLKAIDTGLEALEKLGVSLSPLPSDGSLVVKLPLLEDLENIPTMSDRYQLAALRLLIAVASPAYNAKPEIMPQIILTLVNYCIEYGHSALAAYVYALYGLFLCAALGEMDAGYHSGQLALKLLDQFNAREIKCKVYQLVNVFIKHWKEHIRETIAPLLEGLQTGLETGDIEFVGHSAVAYCPNLFLLGECLEVVNQQQGQYIDLLIKLKQEYPIYTVQVWRQLTLNLIGQSQDKWRLSGESFDESKMIPLFINSNNRTLLFVVYFAKSILFYNFKNKIQALTNAKLAAEHAEAMIGGIIFAAHNFYYSLALLAVYPEVEASEQQKYIQQVEENQQKMQQWSAHSPANFRHKYELIEAEKARVSGQIGVAMEYYERAIEGAKKQGYIQEEALANELAAEFYFYRGRKKIAQTYLTESYYGYIRWGATAKVKNLEETYPHIFSQLLARESTTLEVTRTTSLTTAAGSMALDLATVMKASQALAGEIVLSNLLEKLLKIMMENAGAQNSCLILQKNEQLMVEAVGDVALNEVLIGQSLPVEKSDYLPISIINYVHRTRASVVLNNANSNNNFTTDTYIIKKKPKSILCTPIINQNKLLGMVYLENNLIPGAFRADRIELLKLLSSQAAISLNNAILYASLSSATEELKQANTQLEDYSRTLEQKVENRTLELKEKNQHLQQTLQELQHAQSQLIQTEKMSSLGQLVAGIAHEINNPVSFIYGNLKHASGYLQNLLRLIEVYQQQYPNPTPNIEAEAEAIELDYLREDFPKILNSMQTGAERIRQIVLSLRNFSRLDEAEMKPVDIHEGIENTLLILHHRIQEKIGHSGLQIIKNYGNLPKVECYAGQLNQVFMNILANAIDALEQHDRNRSFEEIQNRPSTIRIQTELINNEQVRITIADNGSGMTEALLSKVFDPFFTTKPVGAGTGLGLSISYQIVVEKHGGQLRCISVPNQGAEFIIEIPIRQRKKSSGL